MRAFGDAILSSVGQRSIGDSVVFLGGAVWFIDCPVVLKPGAALTTFLS